MLLTPWSYKHLPTFAEHMSVLTVLNSYEALNDMPSSALCMQFSKRSCTTIANFYKQKDFCWKQPRIGSRLGRFGQRMSWNVMNCIECRGFRMTHCECRTVEYVQDWSQCRNVPCTMLTYWIRKMYLIACFMSCITFACRSRGTPDDVALLCNKYDVDWLKFCAVHQLWKELHWWHCSCLYVPIGRHM